MSWKLFKKINKKFQGIKKMPSLYHISGSRHTCGYDAITFVGLMDSLGVTLTLYYILGLLKYSVPKIGCVQIFVPFL